MASVHRELSDKQSLAFSMTFLPTKLEFTTASAESSFVFEFASPDTRSNFEQAFEEAKKKLGGWTVFHWKEGVLMWRLLFLLSFILMRTTWTNCHGAVGCSYEQGPVGPRVPQGHSNNEDAQWNAGVY